MKRVFHYYNRKIWLVFIITLLIGIFIFSKLPTCIPIHFDISGEADNYGSRWTIFLAPGINFAIILLAESLRKIDPKSGTYKKFEPYYYKIHFIIALLMLGVQLLIISYTFGYEVNVSRIMPLIMGLMFIFLGNMMPKIKPNYFVGIKTSWTLASEKIWYLTHRLTGKVWAIGGILTIFTVFLPNKVIIWTFMIILTVLVLIPVFASLYFYHKYEK